jgi:hypothetical protein
MADENKISTFLTREAAGKSVANFPPPIITINGDDGTPMVKIHPNGTLEYGPNYDPDEAARRFWDAMRIHMPNECPACGHVGLEGSR